MSLKNYEREEERVMHVLGSFSKGDINVWASLRIFILRSKG
jgi:hypothetical protein